MGVPTYDQFIEPILRYLARHPDGAAARDVHEAAAATLGISEAERLELLPSGAQAIYKNRAGWAHDRLKRAGLSSSARRGFWKLMQKGLAFVQANPAKLPAAVIEELAVGNTAVRLRPRAEDSGNASLSAGPSPPTSEAATSSPDDRLEQALAELREATADELLETIGKGSPKFFEMLVLDLLHAMGYRASRADLQHVGRSGDGGIDGIISLDRLGLEKVFVQAKRWQNSVGPSEVQAFYGALAAQHASKGVLITTSHFTDAADDFAKSVGKIVLIDGDRLTFLLMEYGVGVTHRIIKIPKLDLDYFEDA
jgi:restriction system protein